MKLERVKVHDVFQYEDLEIDLSGNLVGIVGHNGTGKSNFLNAIHFAFAGEVPGKTKEQIVRWGCKDGFVEVGFEHEGRKGKIVRHAPGTQASLEYGEDSFSGIRAVNAAISDTLKMDKDVFRLVFVKQAELDSILFDQASRREVTFQKMCGLGEANRMHRALQDLIQKVFAETGGDIEAEIATLESEKAKSETELAETKLHSAEAEKKLAELGPASMLEAEIEKYTLASRLLYAIRSGKAQFDANTTELARLETQLKNLGEVVDVSVVQAARTELEKARAELSRKEALELARAKAEETVMQCSMTVETVKAQEVEGYNGIADLERQVEAETKAVAEGRALANLYKAAIDAFATCPNPVCPVCGGPIPQSLAGTLSGKLSACKTDSSGLDALSRRLSESRRKASELSARLASLVDTISSNQQWLAANPGVGKEHIEGSRKYVSDMQAFADGIAEKAATARNLEWQIRKVSSDIGQYRDNEASYLRQLSEKGVPEGTTYEQSELSLAGWKERLADYNKVNAGYMSDMGAIRNLESRIAGIVRSLADAKRRRDNSENREKAYRVLTKVADWLHYSNGPHKLAARVMDDLTTDTNKFLESLGAPFTVSVDPETLGYVFSMNDGSVESQPADALSGGQKVLLAVSFRLASYCMFAGKYGLLTLDEPTAYLDEANVSNFCSLLDSIKSTAVSMDLQILISTHERAVLPYMDSVLDIDELKAVLS